MKVLGSKVYLNVPKLPDSNLELDEKTRREVQNEMFAKWDRLIVYAVGETVNSTGIGSTIEKEVRIKPGDEVFVDTSALRSAIFVEIEGSKRAIVPYSAIQHVW